MKNKNGQTLGVSVIIAIFIFIVGIPIINIISPDITSAKILLDCSNAAGISDGTKMTCLVVDVVLPYFILLVVSISGGLVVSKFMT